MKRKNPFVSGQDEQKKQVVRMSIDEEKAEPEDTLMHDVTKDPGAPDNEDDLIEVVVLRQEDLTPPTDQFTWNPSLATVPWSEQYAALEHFRQTIKFHASSIQSAFPDTESCLSGLVVPSAEHLRSALTRSGLYCIAEYVQCVQESATIYLGVLVPVLLRRSINEKKFIRDAAHEALDHIVTYCSPQDLVQLLTSFSNDKNPHLVATAGKFIEKSLRRCHDNTTPNQFSTWQPHVAAWLPSLAQFLACRVVACKNDTKRTFALLRDMLGVRYRFKTSELEQAADMTQLATDHLVGSALVDVLRLVKAAPAKKTQGKQPRGLSLKERMLLQQQKANPSAPKQPHVVVEQPDGAA
ncbi:hypothetical protein AaE_015511 [Aphanomyces astaci]|uniref:TOG domain-containing protein n=1 Tax=Aphanomyces astaci TaxID=112090 RepID=A0A6A4Z139_APHAT|nr:hypothetical protein AaE_015511 [Aphanomyces astaci]